MKISEIITDKYKLRIPPTVYYDLLVDVVEAEEEQEPKWTPVSEKLPYENTWVLATCKNSDGYIFLDILLINQYTGLWQGDEDFSGTVIAWMPLPPCFEPQESEDEE